MMKHPNATQSSSELAELCNEVRAFVAYGAMDACIGPICQAMKHYPHAPHPHNLLGIILEKSGDHSAAMKHFRAAWALDPTYLPANHNLNTYGTFFSGGRCAFDESDVPSPSDSRSQIDYDKYGNGHAVRR